MTEPLRFGPPRLLSTRRTVVAAAFAGAVFGLVGWGGMALAFSVKAGVVYCVVVGMAIAVLISLSFHTAPIPGIDANGDVDVESTPATKVDTVVMLGHTLSWAAVDAGRFETRLRPMLVGLIDERLRRRGIDRRRQPDRAREVVGEDLWELISPASPGTATPPGASRIRRWVSAMERL